MKQLDEKRVLSPLEKDELNGHRNTVPVKDYEPPKIEKTEVKTEGGFCASEPVKGEVTTTDPVEVEEYVSIGGDDGKIDITFD